MAPGRSGAHAMTFEISGSYAVGTVQPSIRAAVVANARPRRCAQVRDQPGRRQKSLVRVFRVDAHFDRVAMRLD